MLCIHRLPSYSAPEVFQVRPVLPYLLLLTAGGRSVPGMGLTTSEAFHHNSTTASLCSPAWQVGEREAASLCSPLDAYLQHCSAHAVLQGATLH